MTDVNATEPAFVFAHLSDPHLSSPAGVPLKQLANKRLLSYLSWRTGRRSEHRREVVDELVADLQALAPDHVVITGDMTHLGLPCEFRQVGLWLREVGPAERVTIVPGNHDQLVREDWDATFAHWGEYLASDRQRAHIPGSSRFPILRVRKQVAFIGLSTATPTAPLLATGRLGQAQLRALDRILADTGRRGLFRCVMLHHPPDVGSMSWRKRLTDAGRLRAIVSQHGAELLLHGHAHSSRRGYFETPFGQVPLFGVPSASALGHGSGHPARYHLHRLVGDRQGWHLQTTIRAYIGAGLGFEAQGEFEDFIPRSSLAVPPG